jgi:ubiquinone/menaquinone biosynthesis C-methylase UbiE
VVELEPEIDAYYERGEEATRLAGGQATGPLELVRTKELVQRHLPDRAPLRVLDVGGGPGVYATWLLDLGHAVHLVDAVPLHVRQARAADPRITTEVGDARTLTQPDASFDVVLLFGPQYHLVDRADRLRVLSEARRVLVPGGLVFVAAIARCTVLLEQLIRTDRLHEPPVFDVVIESVRTGVFRGSVGDLFTTAYLHLPDELAEELADAGFDAGRVFHVEGPGFLLADIADRWADPARRDVLLRTARAVESEPALQAVGGHLLAVGSRPR